MTKLKPKLIPDPDTYIIFEKGTKHGISYISNRYSKANNKYLKSYDTKHIIYLDVINLNGYAMSRFLSTSDFKWIDPIEFDLKKYTSSSSKGSILEIDLEYPKELRELHNHYFLVPDKKKKIKKEMLSKHQLKIAYFYNILIGNDLVAMRKSKLSLMLNNPAYIGMCILELS